MVLAQVRSGVRLTPRPIPENPQFAQIQAREFIIDMNAQVLEHSRVPGNLCPSRNSTCEIDLDKHEKLAL